MTKKCRNRDCKCLNMNANAVKDAFFTGREALRTWGRGSGNMIRKLAESESRRIYTNLLNEFFLAK